MNKRLAKKIAHYRKWSTARARRFFRRHPDLAIVHANHMKGEAL